MTEEYACGMCHDVFEKTTPEYEAKAKLKKYFGDVSVEDCDIVCEDCWQKIKPDRHGFSLPVLEGDL